MAALAFCPAATSRAATASALGPLSKDDLSFKSVKLQSTLRISGRSLHRPRSASGSNHSHYQHRPLHVASVATTKELATELTLSDKVEDEVVEEPEEEDDDETPIPNAFEIQSLLMELCDETNIAEVQLKVGSFELHVRRDVGGKASRAVAGVVAVAPPVPSPPMINSIPAAPAPPKRVVEEDEEEVDEGLAFVSSPKVGIFRKGRFYKGKHGRPMVTEGVEVKAGQVVCYLEQLGTQLAVESEHAGEVVKVMVEDGDPVGYGEALIAVRPSFVGIKKLT